MVSYSPMIMIFTLNINGLDTTQDTDIIRLNLLKKARSNYMLSISNPLKNIKDKRWKNIYNAKH